MYDQHQLGQNLAYLLVIFGAVVMFRKACNASLESKKAAAQGGIALLRWLFKK